MDYLAKISSETALFLTSATLLFAVVISLIQYIFEKKQIYLLSLIYWLSILMSAFVNLLISDIESPLYLLSGLGTYISNTVLAIVMLKIKELNFKIAPNAAILVGGFGLSILLRVFGFSYQAYSYTMLVAAASPIFYAFILGLTKAQVKFSSAQLLFYIAALFLGLHYCDYPFFKAHPELFGLALIVALILIFALAVLMPMAVNEYELFVRNRDLEKEVSLRIQQLREKDLQAWSNEKFTSIGKISGLLAHELNTPLASISAAASLIQKYCVENNLEESLAAKNSFQIKKVIGQISNLTDNLKKAAGDQLGQNKNLTSIDQLLEELRDSISDMVQSQKMSYVLNLSTKDLYVNVNQSELRHAIRMAVLFLLNENSNTNIRQKLLHISCDQENRKLIFKNEAFENNHNGADKASIIESASLTLENSSDFMLVIMKSLLQANNSDIQINKFKDHSEIEFIF